MVPIPPGGCDAGGGGCCPEFNAIANLPAVGSVPVGQMEVTASINSMPETAFVSDGGAWQQIGGVVVQPHVIVSRATNQTIPTGVATEIMWDAERADKISFHNPGDAQLNVPSTGLGDIWNGIYSIGCALTLIGVDAGTNITLRALVNGGATTVYEHFHQEVAGGGVTSVFLPTLMLPLDEGEDVRFDLLHDNATDIDVYGEAGTGAEFAYSNAHLVRVTQIARIVR